MITSYAQNFEDVILWRALQDIEAGFYIDVGANDPVSDSVSKAFYDRGWRGIHIEPVPQFADKLREARPDETVIEAALGTKTGKMEFFEVEDTGLATGIAETSANHTRSGYEVSPRTVPVKTLSSVFRNVKEPDIHWLKIDVEGMEAAVLEGWGRSARRPWILVIESTEPNSTRETHSEWEALIEARGYSPVYFDGLNRFYLHESQIERKKFFGPGPNYFDGFRLTERSVFNGDLAERINAADGALANQQSMLEDIANKTNAIGDLEYRMLQTKAEKDALTLALTSVGDGLSAAIENAVADARAERNAVLDNLQAEHNGLLAAFSELTERHTGLEVAHTELAQKLEVQVSQFDELATVHKSLQAETLTKRREFIQQRFDLEDNFDQGTDGDLLTGIEQQHTKQNEAIIRAQLSDIRALQAQIDAIKQSASWKFSIPVRLGGRLMRGMFGLGKPFGRKLAEWALAAVRKLPSLKAPILFATRLVPPLHRKLEKFVLVRPLARSATPQYRPAVPVMPEKAEEPEKAEARGQTGVSGQAGFRHIKDGKTKAGAELLSHIEHAGKIGHEISSTAPGHALNGSTSLDDIAALVRAKAQG